MSRYADAIDELIDRLATLPGIGRKSAQRLAFHIIKGPEEEAIALAKAILGAKSRIHFCQRCYNLTDHELCPICQNPLREQGTICVVEDAKDVIALERMRTYQGLYHVLGGALNPMEGIGPDQLKIQELVARLYDDAVDEVILATNSGVEGEATALYLTKMLKPLGVKVTRIAQGLPVGGDIEYADEVTLARAFSGRREV